MKRLHTDLGRVVLRGEREAGEPYDTSLAMRDWTPARRPGVTEGVRGVTGSLLARLGPGNDCDPGMGVEENVSLLDTLAGEGFLGQTETDCEFLML